MITKINETNQLKYEDLFKRAWNELWYRGAFSEDELKYYYPANTFTSLEDYFTKIATLIKVEDNATYPVKINQYDGNEYTEIDNPKYDPDMAENNLIEANYEFILLPIDEPRFEINPNTREISIPVNFRKLVGVQGDHVAETLVFSIDRFVDYYDLLPSNVNQMKIYVQWKDEYNTDKLSPISIIHYEADTQKILFGWPLTSTITKEPRTIDFSIRFIIIDNDDKVKYSLNTKTHQVSIVKALQPIITSNTAIDEAADSFLDAIINSPSTEAPPAAVPHFSAPGLNLDAIKDFGDAAGELKVQAVVSGLGYIDYTRWTKNGANITDNISIVYEESSDENRQAQKTYYIQKDGFENIYEIYTGDIPANETLYERYYVLNIPASNNDIIGTYKAYAVNRTSSNVSAEVASSECIVPGPSSISYAINGNLNSSALPVGTNTGVALEVKINKTNTNDFLVYEWYYDSENANMVGAGAPIQGATGSIYNIPNASLVPGYYKVKVWSKRNRKLDNAIESNICRVTGKPEIPVINTINITPGAAEGGDIDSGTLTTLTAQANAFGQHESDGLTYKWYGQFADGGVLTEIVPANAAIYRADKNDLNGFNTSILYVYGGDVAITYKCIAQNLLNGQTSAFSSTENAPEVTLI